MVMGGDLAIKYKALYQKVEMMLDNIKEIGIDISIYEQTLKQIQNEVNNNVKNSYIDGYARACYEQYYSKGLGNLQKLKNQLDKYDIYYRVFKSCKWIEMKLDDSNISHESLEQYVNEMILNIKSIIESDTLDYDNEKHIVESVYKVAYDLIKLELTMTGDSKIYRYTKSKEINISYFNTLIKKDINIIIESNKMPDKLMEKVLELSKKGIDSDYYDLSLITRILICNNSFDYKKVINDNVNKVANGIASSNKQIDDMTRELASCDTLLKEKENNTKKTKSIIRRRIISLTTTLSIIVSGGVVANRIAKKNATHDVYTKNTEIYTSFDDKTTASHTEEFSYYFPPDDYTVIREYPPYYGDTEDTYLVYDVSHVDFGTAKEYYDYGVDNFKIVPKEKSDKKHKFILDDGYTEVEKVHYDYLGKQVNKSEYSLNMVLEYTIYILLLCVAELFYVFADCSIIVFSDISKLLKLLKELNNNKKEYNDKYRELVHIVNSITLEINNNETLRTRFNELYEENKDLLNESDELIKIIENISDSQLLDDVKKSIENIRYTKKLIYK